MKIGNTFHIRTYGCTFNQGDSQLIRSIFINRGFVETTPNHADIIIFNTCAVKSQTEHKIKSSLRRLKPRINQKVIIAGCLPWISHKNLNFLLNLRIKLCAIVDVNSLNNLPEIVDKHEKTGKTIVYSTNIKSEKHFRHIDEKSTTGIIPICEGCIGSCTFCCTKSARGKLYSYSPTQILGNINYSLKKGSKEIYLTAQNCGVYKWNNDDLSSLVKYITENIQSKSCRIRVGMMDPSYLIKNFEGLVNGLCDSIYYNFLHIPIQSASNSVLKSMNRKYRREHVSKIFENMLRNNITIATDIICGFPGESEDDFNDTIDFISKFKPYIVNISKFTARPNTAAKEMKQMNSEIIKKRTKKISKMIKEFRKETHFKQIGRTISCLITKNMREKEYPYSGKTDNYMPVVLENACLNNFNRVEIVDSTANYLIGHLIDN